MKTIEIKLVITVPDDVTSSNPSISVSKRPAEDPTRQFWFDLGSTARGMFQEAARIETVDGPGYTFEDIAEALHVEHAAVLAYNRNASRSAKSWEERTGQPAPIRFEIMDYAPIDNSSSTQRSKLRLPDGMADRILDFS